MPGIRTDVHAHTTYSDGWDWREMVAAAAEEGLERLGFTDHCIPWEDPVGRSRRYDFHETYRERRREFEAAGTASEAADGATVVDGVTVLDGVEMNYDPAHEGVVREFLEDANFEYAIGSVHYAAGYDLTAPGPLGDADRAAKREAIEAYLDWQVALIESELFDVLGHLDLPQRSPSLRGLMDREDYRRLAEALADSRTVPEINAGRLDREYGEVHPHPDFLEPFAELDVPFVVGTDSHAPDQLRSRVAALEPVLESLPVELVEVPGLES